MSTATVYDHTVSSDATAGSGSISSYEVDCGAVLRGSISPLEVKRATVTCTTKLGKRKKQEDRCMIMPAVLGHEDVSFLAVFDGTVGEHAADFVHHNIHEHIFTSKSFRDALVAAEAAGGFAKPAVAARVEAAFKEGYRATDGDLLKLCAEKGFDYTSCTSVTALIAGDLLTVAHLGDSKIVLGRDNGSGGLVGKYLTIDHKPDMVEERLRIERSGGSLAYLHGGKPFIRGGDFTARQAKGDRPMQLNYSRAFGGKDLKPYGLIALPDVLQLQLSKADRLVIVASDGLWDVASADIAVRRAWESLRLGRDPSLDLVDWALAQHDLKGTIDNVTVIVAALK
jgi:serine/threonine protein phosphatase PrpC